MNAMEADQLSRTLAETAVKIATDIFGGKKPTHEKRKYESFDLIKTQAEINTIEKARDLIRTLYLNEVTSLENRLSLENHLSTLLVRLCRMGLHSVPLQHDLKSLHEWSQSTAKADIENLRRYMESQKSDMDAIEKRRQNEMFLNPQKRGQWFDRIFSGNRTACPNFAIDSKTGRKTFDMKEVKEIYLREGTSFLKNRQDIRPQFDEKKEEARLPTPDLLNRDGNHEILA